MTATVSDNGVTYGNSAAAQALYSVNATNPSNTLVVTLDPTTIAFRSTTLTTGTPTVVQNASQLSLTIASTDSFGLVTAAGSQRIVILAINNAGTMELAASSIAGGVALDETGVITTVTAATTNAQIKSATARTGVAYKVVGFVDATFTTGTGWGSLVTVQGQGGQALTGMSSLGYSQKWQSVSRALGTTYYNTTGRPIVLHVQFWAATPGPVGVGCTVNGQDVGYGALYGASAGYGGTNTFIIPPGASYVPYNVNVGTVNFFELR